MLQRFQTQTLERIRSEFPAQESRRLRWGIKLQCELSKGANCQSRSPSPLPLGFCHHAIREMLFGAIAHRWSIPQKPLHTLALGGLLDSLGDLWRILNWHLTTEKRL